MMKAWIANILLKWVPKYRRRMLILACALTALAIVRTPRVKQAFVNWLVAGVVVDHVHVKDVHVGEHSISLDPGGVDVIRWSATTNPTQAGDLGMNTTAGRPVAFIGGAAQKLGSALDVFGDGSDGAFTTAANLTQLRDSFYTNLSTSGAFNIFPAGTRVYVQGTLTLASGTAISCNGNAGSGVNAGAATARVSVREGFAGGNGGNNGVGTAGTAQTTACFHDAIGLAGAGSAGGAATNAGGIGGVLTSNGNTTGIARASAYMLGFVLGLSTDGAGTPTTFAMCGGGGGGGGGSSAAGTTGGGGGSGAGVCIVAANTITGAGNITCNGGAGGNAAGAANGGGGGGGGAGTCVVIYLDKSGWTGTCQANGGGGGTGIGTGAAGTAGSNGACLLLQAS